MALRFICKQSSPSDGRRAYTFSVAAFCVIICFAATAIPVPLIAIWTQALSLTTFEVSMTVFAYVGGCLTVLLFFSKLSNYLGRRATVILTLAIGIASCLCFIAPQNASAIILGRLLQGVFAGLATSAAMSWTVDTAPKSHAWLGTALSAAGPGIGFILGTVLSGLSAETGIISADTLFIGLAVTLAVVLAAAIPAVETMQPGAVSLIRALTPSFGIPPKARRVFPLCAVSYIGTWALSTWFQGFSAMIGSAVFTDGQPSPASAALTYMLLVAPYAAGGILCGKLNPRKMLLPLLTGSPEPGCLRQQPMPARSSLQYYLFYAASSWARSALWRSSSSWNALTSRSALRRFRRFIWPAISARAFRLFCSVILCRTPVSAPSA